MCILQLVLATLPVGHSPSITSMTAKDAKSCPPLPPLALRLPLDRQ